MPDGSIVRIYARRAHTSTGVIGFFCYCLRSGWIKGNPATLLVRIKARDKPTNYFTKEEFEKIIQATYVYNPKAWNRAAQATRVRTLILLMALERLVY